MKLGAMPMQRYIARQICGVWRMYQRRVSLYPYHQCVRSFCQSAFARRQYPRTQGQQFAELLRQRMEEQLGRSSPQAKPYPYRRVVRRGQPFVRTEYSKARTSDLIHNESRAWQNGSWTQTHPRIVLVGLAAGGAGVYYVLHLEQVPSTGRWRFMDVSPMQEWKMGEEAYQSVMRQYSGQILPSWTSASTQVNRVAKRIIRACEAMDAQRAEGAPPSQWTVHVVHEPRQKNAFVLPGGHIFVFTGILPVCENDAGLATVMAHEVAHQIARHSAEKMAGSKILMAGAFVLNLIGLDIGLSQILLNLMLSLPNSRKIESEADELGLRIMSQACYDPRQAVRYVVLHFCYSFS